MSNIFTELNLNEEQAKRFEEVRQYLEKSYGRLSKMGTVRMLIREKWIELNKEKTGN